MLTTDQLLKNARSAKSAAASMSEEKKNAALEKIADALIANEGNILAANVLDLADAEGVISPVMLDRLRLTSARIAGMADGLRDVAALPDPVGRVIKHVERPNGLVIEKISAPMGVIAIIYESRPNVTSDAAALCLKSGSVAVLRCGK